MIKKLFLPTNIQRSLHGCVDMQDTSRKLISVGRCRKLVFNFLLKCLAENLDGFPSVYGILTQNKIQCLLSSCEKCVQTLLQLSWLENLCLKDSHSN